MKKGELWLVELPSVNSHEQGGTRPALIISDPEANTVVILPFTSNVQALRFPHTVEVNSSKRNGLTELSIALVFQVRAIDRKRLKIKVGEIEEGKMKEIDILLKKLLQL